MTAIHIFPLGTKLFQDSEGTVPAEKDGDMVARVEYPDGLVAIQHVVSRRPTFRANFKMPTVEISKEEWLFDIRTRNILTGLMK